MRRFLFGTAAGLLLAPVLGLAPARGSELSGGPAAGPAKGPQPVPARSVKPAGATCGSFGTSVAFLANPAEAGRQASRDSKLLFVLHISGNFEDRQFT